MDKEELMRRTADNIRLYRKKRGMSQEDLALEADMPPAYLGHIERCLKCPTINTLNRIANALGIPVSMLLVFPEDESYRKEKIEASDRIAAALAPLSEEKADKVANLVLDIVQLMKE